MLFFNKKITHISTVQYDDAKGYVDAWVAPVVVSVITIAVTSGAFLYGCAWVKAPCIVAILVLLRSMYAIKNHHKIIEKYYQQASIKEIEKEASESLLDFDDNE